MRPSTAPTRSPEGMSAPGSQEPQHFAGNHPMTGNTATGHRQESAPHPDNYDDGLVHNHNWATATARHTARQ